MPEHPFLTYEVCRLTAEERLQRASTFYQQMSQRRSVRHFSDLPVPRRLIELAILTASSSPSGANRQPWTFAAVSDPDVKRQIRAAAEQEERALYEGGRMPKEWRQAIAHLETDWHKPYLEDAPWLVVVFEQTYGLDEQQRRVKNYYVKESVGMACGLFVAAIHTMGLATLTHTPSPMGFLSDILARPANERPFILFPVGFPAANAKVPDQRRKPLEEIVHWYEKPS